MNYTLTGPQKAMLSAVAYAQVMNRKLEVKPRRRSVLRRVIEIGLVNVLTEDGSSSYSLTPDGAHARTYWRLR